MLNKKALFSDGTKDYRMPCEPLCFDTVTIRFRTGRNNVKMVTLITGEGFYQMDRRGQDRLFDYYETELELKDYPVAYYFTITDGESTCYYNREGAVHQVNEEFNFLMTPGFKTPDWAKGAVLYQIFVDRFFNGDETNDVLDREYIYIGDGTRKVTDWYKYPDTMGVREFYGGDLPGVIQKLDYLEDLGIDAIYLNPIFVSPSNHKYDIQDYDYVDPHFGTIIEDGGENLPPYISDNKMAWRYKQRVTDKRNLEASNEILIQLVEEAHKRGIKVILDGVFNHCGSFNKWLDREGIYEGMDGYEKGAYADKNSPYRSFFKFRNDAWPYNASYDGWWGFDTLPKLNYEESAELYNYIMYIGKKWVSPPFNCDGWRLDVAADLGLSEEFNHRFWKDFRLSVKEANPEAVILAEHYGDPKAWLSGDEWDSVMNYDAFMEPVTWFLTGLEKHSDEFREDMLNHSEDFFKTMAYHMTRFQTSSLQVAMNELSNHDHSRFLTRTSRRTGRTGTVGPQAANEDIRKGVMKAAVVIQMTWVGAPTIYYGDEAGLCGWTDPDNRRAYPWGREDLELIRFHKDMIKIHKSYAALRTGSILFLGGQAGYLSFARFDSRDKFIVAINNNDYEITVDLPAWETGITDEDALVSLIGTTEEAYSLEAKLYYTNSGNLRLTLPPVSTLVLKNQEE